MRPARKSWTPAIKAAGLGMLPTGSVGSTIVATEAVGTARVQETSHATPRPGPRGAFRSAARDRPTLIRVAVILRWAQDVVKVAGTNARGHEAARDQRATQRPSS